MSIMPRIVSPPLLPSVRYIMLSRNLARGGFPLNYTVYSGGSKRVITKYGYLGAIYTGGNLYRR